MGFALMAVNIRKNSAISNENETFSHKDMRKNGCIYLLLINATVFMSQPLECCVRWLCIYMQRIAGKN